MKMSKGQKKVVIPPNGATTMLWLGDPFLGQHALVPVYVLTTVCDRDGGLHVVIDYTHPNQCGQPFVLSLEEFGEADRRGDWTAKKSK